MTLARHFAPDSILARITYHFQHKKGAKMTAKEIKRTLQSEFVRTLRKPFVDAVKHMDW